MNAAAISIHEARAARRDGDEHGRADFYALLARLLYAGPDAALLAAIAGADEIVAENGSAVASAWRALVTAAGAADDEAARAEYDTVFVGVGKAPVTPYASFYLVPTGREKVLVALRERLALLGLARAGHAREPEDHLAGLCDVMRHLIAQGRLEEQKRFFERFLRGAYPAFCDAVLDCRDADFYERVARFARAFLDLESQSFEMV
jgi:TorA maturation chaperone TorD